MFKIILAILILSVMGCSQTTWFPGKVVWNQHDYMTVLHNQIDTLDLQFMVYESNDSLGIYALLGIVQAPDTQLVLLDKNNVYFPELYTGENRYIYLIAHKISDGSNSAPSDTTKGHYFPTDRPARNSYIDIYDIPITGN